MSGHELGGLFSECEAYAASTVNAEEVETAWLAIDATGLSRAAHHLLGSRALEKSLARDQKRGWVGVEAAIRQHPALPANFRANPAQHFYALQNVLAERRRKQWREECDREPDAFGLAA